MVSNDSLALVFSSRPIKMSPCFVLGRGNVPCIAEVVNRSLKAGCTDYTPSTDGKIITLIYLHVSRTCPICILRHCPVHFHCCPFLKAHYHRITSQKWFCACALGTLSTRPQAVTIQTDQVMPGYQLFSSWSDSDEVSRCWI